MSWPLTPAPVQSQVVLLRRHWSLRVHPHSVEKKRPNVRSEIVLQHRHVEKLLIASLH